MWRGFGKIKCLEELQTRNKPPTLKIRRIAETVSYWTNQTAGFHFPNDCVGNANPALGWSDSLESVVRNSFAGIKAIFNTCLLGLGRGLIARAQNKQLSAWLLLNIHYFPSESGPVETGPTGLAATGMLRLQQCLQPHPQVSDAVRHNAWTDCFLVPCVILIASLRETVRINANAWDSRIMRETW